MTSGDESDPGAIETELLLEGIYRRYGYDFRGYARASLRRRIRTSLAEEGLPTISALQGRVLRDPACMLRVLNVLTVETTAMFRDPAFYLAVRRKVVPRLGASPFVRVWHAGCATGEEVYSMAILLTEEGLYDRARLYATDLNGAMLGRAREGVFPARAMPEYTENYLRAGGTRAFSEYYVARYDYVQFRAELGRNVVWAPHNLATDASFQEFQVIFCRNVMIYFGRPLQDRVHRLLYESLAPDGVLGLGSKESLSFTPHEADYEPLDPREKLYRKVR